MLTRRLPGSFWYILYRNKAYKNIGYSAKITSLASGVELAVTIVSGLLISSTFSSSILQELKLNTWLLVIFFITGIILLQPKLLGKLIKKLGSNPDRFGYRQLLTWIISYLLLWLGGGLLFFFIINSIYPLNFTQLGYVIGSWAIVGTVTQFTVLLPSNFGFTEISLSLLLSLIIPSSFAVIIVIMLRVTMIIFEILWTLISVYIKRDIQTI